MLPGRPSGRSRRAVAVVVSNSGPQVELHHVVEDRRIHVHHARPLRQPHPAGRVHQPP